MILVSIDPGVKACGVAVFKDGILISAKYVERKDRCPKALAAAVWDYVTEELPRDCIDLVIVERPRTYGGRASRGDTNDLLDLSIVVGALLVAIGGEYRLVYPADWKKQVPKEIMIARIKSKLSESELDNIIFCRGSKMHNVWDAIGIGLFQLKRLK